jgi:hypothetical protein
LVIHVSLSSARPVTSIMPLRLFIFMQFYHFPFLSIRHGIDGMMRCLRHNNHLGGRETATVRSYDSNSSCTGNQVLVSLGIGPPYIRVQYILRYSIHPCPDNPRLVWTRSTNPLQPFRRSGPRYIYIHINWKRKVERAFRDSSGWSSCSQQKKKEAIICFGRQAHKATYCIAVLTDRRTA